MTALVPEETRQGVLIRANYGCEYCARPLQLTGGPNGYSLQHRFNKAMGGTKAPWINDPENLLALCGSGTTLCHGDVGRQPLWAYARGLALETGYKPHETPFADSTGALWLLDGFQKLRLTLPFTYELVIPSVPTFTKPRAGDTSAPLSSDPNGGHAQ